MNLYADFKLLDATLKSLSGKDEAARIRYCTHCIHLTCTAQSFSVIHRATLEVKVHVETAARELSLERFAKFENELYQVRWQTIFLLFSSPLLIGLTF